MSISYVKSNDSAGVRADTPREPGATNAPAGARKATSLAVVTGQRRSLPAESAATEVVLGPLVLPADDHGKCPQAAAACVDLTRHLTWLQSGGKVTFGPVRMEPGAPGAASSTRVARPSGA